VRCAASADGAMHSLVGFTPDVVLVDLLMPDIDGRAFVDTYRRRVRPAASVIVMSGLPDGAAIARRMGADAYLAKPIDLDNLLRAIALTLAAA